MAVLITVPHGASPTGDGVRNSDEGALRFLPFLEEALEELDIHLLLVGTVNRDILDLNRQELILILGYKRQEKKSRRQSSH